MRVHFEMNNNHKWCDILSKVLNEYNYKDIHRTIGMRRCEVHQDNEEKNVKNKFIKLIRIILNF